MDNRPDNVMQVKIDELKQEILLETQMQEHALEKQLRKPLGERVDAGRALAGLKISHVDSKRKLIHFKEPREDFAFFQVQQKLRLSQNAPETNYVSVTFHGLTKDGLSVGFAGGSELDFSVMDGWSLDEDFIDLSHFYLEGIKQLMNSEHGRDHVFPALFDPQDNLVNAEEYSDTMDALDEEDSELNDPQREAVATALASSPMYLIQGPPGTGKTQTLAKLVEQLVLRGHRVLVSSFTHRAIHNALSKVTELLGDSCPVCKISQALPSDNLPFEIFPTLSESRLDNHDGPFVIGATPFAVFSKNRMQEMRFDSAVIDETSQLNIPSAILLMLKSDRWFFFGDDKQLPPVSMIHKDRASDASVFKRLNQQKSSTLLSITYRMNQKLTEWSSEQFYHGQLSSHFAQNRLHLKQYPQYYQQVIEPSKPLVSWEIENEDSRSKNDNEADITVGFVDQLIRSGVEPRQIGIVTPFRAQASLMRTLLKNLGDRSGIAHLEKLITVDTVDRFQGQEREVILYSFTASEKSFLDKIKSFILQPERLNVAVTRARTKVILVYSTGFIQFLESFSGYSEAADLFLSLLEHSENVNE